MHWNSKREDDDDEPEAVVSVDAVVLGDEQHKTVNVDSLMLGDEPPKANAEGEQAKTDGQATAAGVATPPTAATAVTSATTAPAAPPASTEKPKDAVVVFEDEEEETVPDLYDCRKREWYIEAATCTKDIVILVDNTGSMWGVRKAIAHLTVRQLLETFGANDFVSVISYNDTAKSIIECFEGTLVQVRVV